MVELMIVVAIIGILAGVVTSKFGDVLTRSREGSVKSNLGLIRSALNVYYSENLAYFPTGAAGNNQSTLENALVPKYLKSITKIQVYPYHSEVNTVDNYGTTAITQDDGEWAYISVYSHALWGTLLVECQHGDTKSSIFSSY